MRLDRNDGSASHRWTARTGDALCGVALIAGGLALGMPRYRLGINLADEGFLAYGAARTLAGQLPNRDFVSLQPPLSFYTSAATFATLGTSLAALRLLGLLIYLAIPLLVYAIARHRGGHATALGAATPAVVVGLPYFHFVPFAVWHGVLFALIATLCVLRATDSGGTAWSALAGVATALTILSRHDQGVYLVVAIVAYLFASRWIEPRDRATPAHRVLLPWAAATALPLVVLMLYWWVRGALPAMYAQLVRFPLATYVKTSSLPMPTLHFRMTREDVALTALYYLAPLVGAGVAAWLLRQILRRSFRDEHARIGFLLVLSMLFYAQVLTRSDLYHLIITFAPLFVLIAWTVDACCASAPLIVRALPSACGVWLLLALGPTFLNTPASPLSPLDVPRGHVSVDPPTARWLESVVAGVQHDVPPDRSMLALPYSPMFYFLCERRNPTHWNYLFPGDQTPADHEAFVAQARSDPPALAVIMNEDKMVEYARPIVEYVRSDFRLVHESGVMRIYLAAAPGAR